MPIKPNRFFYTFIVLILLAFSCSKSVARDLPVRLVPINDEIGLLDNQTTSEISNLCKALSRYCKSEIAVLIINSTEGVSSSDFALRVFNHWGLGQTGVDNGMLVMFAIADRRVEIKPGTRYKSHFTESFCANLLTTYVVPEMKAGRPAQGVLVAVREVADVVKRIEERGVKKIDSVSNYKYQNIAHSNYSLAKTALIAHRGPLPKDKGLKIEFDYLRQFIWDSMPGFISDSDLISIFDGWKESNKDPCGNWCYFEGSVNAVSSPFYTVECRTLFNESAKFYFNVDKEISANMRKKSHVHVVGKISKFSEKVDRLYLRAGGFANAHSCEVILEQSILLNAPFIALENDDLELVAYLLGALKYNPNAKISYKVDWSLLHAAASRDDLAMVKLLVQSGALVDTYSYTSGSPLDAAIHKTNNFDIIKYLFSVGARPIVGKHISSLNLCCRRQDELAVDIAKLLIEKGCDVNLRPEYGNYPILIAAYHHSPLLKFLLENGADPNVLGPTSSSYSGNLIYDCEARCTALIAAIGFAEFLPQGLDTIRLLIQFGADVNLPYTLEGNLVTPLGVAIECGRLRVIQMLVENGADVNQKFYQSGSRSLITPLYAAESRSSYAIAKFLKAHGAR